jgi:DNA-directed RNA polymerase subunit M/transcription elongation factor TFIIS
MIALIEPESRFNKTISEYRKDRINSDSRPVYPLDYDFPFEYCCSNCKYVVSIKNTDFEKHSKSKHSNIQIADRNEIEDYLISNQLDKFSFLDFECPKCNLPVRILFESYPGGFCGMTYEIKYVIEIKNE